MGGASDGDFCSITHVPRLLHRGLQTTPRVQLGARHWSVFAYAGTQLHRLPSAMGPTRVLGNHCWHEYRRLRAIYRPEPEIPDAGWERGRPGSADPFLRVACDRATGGGRISDCRPPLACAQGRRAVAPRRAWRCRPAGRAQPVAHEQDLRSDGTGARHDSASRPKPGRGGVLLASSDFPRAAVVPVRGSRGVAPCHIQECATGRTGEPDSSPQPGESAVVLSRPAGTGQLLRVLGRRRGAWGTGCGPRPAALRRRQTQRGRALVCPRASRREYDLYGVSRGCCRVDYHRHAVPRSELVLARALEKTSHSYGGSLTWLTARFANSMAGSPRWASLSAAWLCLAITRTKTVSGRTTNASSSRKRLAGPQRRRSGRLRKICLCRSGKSSFLTSTV